MKIMMNEWTDRIESDLRQSWRRDAATNDNDDETNDRQSTVDR